MSKQGKPAKQSVVSKPLPQKATGSAYHHGDLQQAFKKAALEVLAGPTPHLLSFRNLARSLGVTTAAPYHHFKDRTGLLVEIATEGFNLLYRKLESASTRSKSNDALIRNLTIVYLDFAREQRGYYQAMFLPEVCAVRDAAELRQAADQEFQFVCNAIKRVDGHLTPQELSDRAVSLWSFLHGVITLRVAGTLGRRLSPECESKFAVDAVKRLISV